MGMWISKVATWVWSGFENDPVSVLMLGLDAAGKTTIMYKMKLNENVVTIPTIGFNVESIEIGKGVTFTLWDVGGQEKLRELWRHYYQNAKGLVFVVDSCDRARMVEGREELFNICNHPDMKNVPVVVLANKQDMPNACNSSELIDKLQLNQLYDHKWYIQATCAVTGQGLYEGMHEMAKMVKEYQKNRKTGYL